MNKTLHKKLTEKHLYTPGPVIAYAKGDSMTTMFMPEMLMLHEAAKDLVSPRPEAISRLLRLAREI